MTREQLVTKGGGQLNFPPLDGLEREIAGWFVEAGMVAPGFEDGPVPLSWTEVTSWAQATGVPVDCGAVPLIRYMSTAYVAELRRASDKDVPEPEI